MPRSANEVILFITPTVSIKEFYDFVTNKGKNFNYCMGLGGSRGGYTALHVACMRQNLPLVKALLSMGGVNPNQIRDNHYPPLYDAIESGNLESVKALIEHGARLDYRVGSFRYERLIDVAKKGGNKDIIDYLTPLNINAEKVDQNYEDLDKIEYEIKEALDKAVKENDYDKAKNILENKTICIGNTLFGFKHYCSPRVAAENGNMKMVELLAPYCDDLIEADGFSDQTVPQAARKAKHPEIAKFLEETQKARYKCLKAAAEQQIKVSKNDSHAKNSHSFFHKFFAKDEVDKTSSSLQP